MFSESTTLATDSGVLRVGAVGRANLSEVLCKQRWFQTANSCSLPSKNLEEGSISTSKGAVGTVMLDAVYSADFVILTESK